MTKSKIIQLAVGIVLLVPIVFWPGSLAGRLATLPVGVLIVLAWGGLWPWRRRRFRLSWRRSLDILFRAAFLALLTFTGFILLTYDTGGKAEGLLEVLMKSRAFVGLFSATWVVILVRFALTRTAVPVPTVAEPPKVESKDSEPKK